jgi:phage-related protein
MPFDPLPSIGVAPTPGSTSGSQEPRLLESQFGDGYSQRAADGLNNQPYSLSLTWENVTSTQATTLLDFFRAKGGVTPFLFTPPLSATEKQWLCKKWDWSYSAATLSVTATFNESFDIA